MARTAQTANLRRLLERLAERGSDVADEITRRIRSEISELASLEDPAFWHAVHDSSAANIRAGLAALEGRSLPSAAPLDAADAARSAADAGVSLASLLRAYRIAHAVTWAEWLRAIEALALEAPERTALLEQGSQFLFAFVDHVATLVTDEYTRERDNVLRTNEQRRARIVEALLEGSVVDATDLGYDISLEHLGVIAWGEEPDALVALLAERLERRVLTFGPAEGVVWAWLGGRGPIDSAARQRLRDVVVASGTRVAFGDPAAGPDGFRRTHREAREAQRIGDRLGSAVTDYDDVALEGLVSRDERAAREFVTRELAGLEGGDQRARTLRETLRAYFDSGQNAAAAAARLGVHDQTVTNRLRKVEERLGRPVAARAVELEVAVRLRDLFGESRDHSGARRPEVRP